MFKTAALSGIVSGRQKIAAEKNKKKSGGGMARGLGAAAGALAGGAAGAILPLYGLTRDAAAPLLARIPKGIRGGHVLAAGGLLGALGGGYLGHKAMGAIHNMRQETEDELARYQADGNRNVLGLNEYADLEPEHWASFYKMPHIEALVNQYGAADHPAVDDAVYREADKLLGR